MNDGWVVFLVLLALMAPYVGQALVLLVEQRRRDRDMDIWEGPPKGEQEISR